MPSPHELAQSQLCPKVNVPQGHVEANLYHGGQNLCFVHFVVDHLSQHKAESHGQGYRNFCQFEPLGNTCLLLLKDVVHYMETLNSEPSLEQNEVDQLRVLFDPLNNEQEENGQLQILQQAKYLV